MQEICLKNYQFFFQLYHEYLEVDSIIALSEHGRNRNILSMFLQLFSKILKLGDKDIVADPSGAKLLKSSFMKVRQYVKDNSEFSNKLIIGDNSDNNFEIQISPILSEKFSIFYDAFELYVIHRETLSDNDILNIYIKSNKNYQRYYFGESLPAFEQYIINQKSELNIVRVAVLKQALMEFNNAVSHLFYAFYGQETLENIRRAGGHIERATLDFYKAIIRDRTALELFTDVQKEAFKKIRIEEYTAIGKVERSQVIKGYHDFLSDYLFRVKAANS